MKKKLNWVAVINMIGFAGSLSFILKIAFELSIKPFFTSELAQLTPFGVVLTILMIILFGNTFEYFEERLKKN